MKRVLMILSVLASCSPFLFAAGSGYHIIKTDRNVLDVFGGFDYDRDKFAAYSLLNPTPPPLITQFAARAQNSATARKCGNGATLNVAASPPTSDPATPPRLQQA